MEQRIATLEEEMRIQRTRSHDYGNKLTEQGSHIEDARDDIKDLKGEMNTRFDKLSAQAWKIAGFVVTVMILAATIVSLVLR